MMKYALALALCLGSAPAFATCKSDAAEKKLAGAALKSFLGECEKDARAAATKACDTGLWREEARRRCQEQPHEEMRDRQGLRDRRQLGAPVALI